MNLIFDTCSHNCDKFSPKLPIIISTISFVEFELIFVFDFETVVIDKFLIKRMRVDEQIYS